MVTDDFAKEEVEDEDELFMALPKDKSDGFNGGTDPTGGRVSIEAEELLFLACPPKKESSLRFNCLPKSKPAAPSTVSDFSA